MDNKWISLIQQVRDRDARKPATDWKKVYEVTNTIKWISIVIFSGVILNGLDNKRNVEAEIRKS